MLRVARAPRGVYAPAAKYVDLKITTAYVQNRPSREKRTELPRDRRVFATTRCATGGRVAAPHTSVHDDRLYIRSVHLDMCQGVSARVRVTQAYPAVTCASRECRCKAPGRPRCTRASWTCVFVRGNEPFRTALARVGLCSRCSASVRYTRDVLSRAILHSLRHLSSFVGKRAETGASKARTRPAPTAACSDVTAWTVRCRALVGSGATPAGRVGHLANEPYCPQHEDHELFAIPMSARERDGKTRRGGAKTTTRSAKTTTRRRMKREHNRLFS